LDDNGDKIVVKFTPKYNEHAHKLCADNKLVPKLLHIEDVGKWKMVIMEHVDGITLDKAYNLKQVSCKNIYEDIKSAINLLHKKHYVFHYCC